MLFQPNTGMAPYKDMIIERVYLWDGSKRLTGDIELKLNKLLFRVSNFKESKLLLRIDLNRVRNVQLYDLYDLVTTGVEIVDDQQRKYVFILEDPESLLEELRCRISLV